MGYLNATMAIALLGAGTSGIVTDPWGTKCTQSWCQEGGTIKEAQKIIDEQIATHKGCRADTKGEIPTDLLITSVKRNKSVVVKVTFDEGYRLAKSGDAMVRAFCY